MRFVSASRPQRSDATRRPEGQRYRISSRPSDGNRASSKPPTGSGLLSRPPGSDHKNDHSHSATTGHNHSSGGDSTAKCFNCGKAGHYSRDCPTRPRVFAAQVLDEDEGSPSRERDEKDDSRHEDEGVKEDAAEHSVPGNDNEDPNGSQYDSERGDESPVEYLDYFEDDVSSNEDEDIVFIRAIRVTEQLMPIPSDWHPLDLLKALSPSSRTRLYLTRKREGDQDWSPSHRREVNDPPRELAEISYLIEMGYTLEDQHADADWLEKAATRHPQDFQSVTGYQAPTPPRCEECGDCFPRVEEIMYRDSEGALVPCYRMMCCLRLPTDSIHAMNATDDTPATDASHTEETQGDGPELVPIPEGWYPIDVLHALTDDDRLAVFIARKHDEDVMWTPSEAPEGVDPKDELPADLAQLGYTPTDEFVDADWLETLLNSDYALFQQLTGYRKRYDCPICGDCLPRVDEVRDRLGRQQIPSIGIGLWTHSSPPIHQSNGCRYPVYPRDGSVRRYTKGVSH